MDKENKTKIYLADTEVEEIEKLEKYFLGKDGYQIVGKGTSGEQVLADVKNVKPDFLVMEVLLGGVDGFKVLESCKKDMGNDCPKVIFVSNLSHAGFISKAMKEGADYFMVKPISPENLEERIIDLSADQSPAVIDGDKQLDEKISNIFISIGIPAHIKGYQFLREAVKLAVVQPDIIASITKRLYPTIAEKFSTSSSKVERGMRHAIEVAWNRGKIENINNLFGFKIYGANDKPTNGELIALIADKMIMEG
ncbi:MAG: sporulation transcription factor Spo0A [Clostridia bacterium]|nr:sporulation transcription factor Spo0A [Clostridia bacterium]MBQ8793006.1 sporulation transcription factor Spo0A [Clostridia bacterium]